MGMRFYGDYIQRKLRETGMDEKTFFFSMKGMRKDAAYLRSDRLMSQSC